MTGAEREQLGWEIHEKTFNRFKKVVKDEWGAVTPYIVRELEDAIREFLCQDAYVAVESRAHQIAVGTDQDKAGSHNTDRLSRLPDPSQPRTTIWTSINSALKQDLAAFAEQHEYPKWAVLTAAVQEYNAGGRARRLREMLSSEVIDAVTDDTSVADQLPDESLSDHGTAITQFKTHDYDGMHPRDMLKEATSAIESNDDSIYGSVITEPTDDLQEVNEPVQVESNPEIIPEHKVIEVINLLADGDDLPYSFFEWELFQTAAEAGVAVWLPDRRDEFAERLLDRLNYERDTETGQFGPVLGDDYVADLSAAAEPIVSALETDLSRPLQEAIEEWYDMHGFDSDSTSSRVTVARQAVFNLLLKTTLYEWFYRRYDIPELASDPRQALRDLGERTGWAAFDETVLDEVVWLADEDTLEPVIDARHRLLRSLHPDEDIGRLYEELTPADQRRTLGQYHTPQYLAEMMRTWASNTGDYVLDPGIGAGTLSIQADPHWESLNPATAAGIDRSPLSLLMARTALTLARRPHETHNTDFLSLTPNDLSRNVDAVICNPPYTRHQSLPSDYKDTINTQVEQETGRDISATSPLYAYFYYHAGQFLDAGDRASFITPHNFLYADYGESLKQYLLEEFDIKALVLFDPNDDPLFEDAETTSLVTFLEAADDDEDVTEETRFIKVEGEPDKWTLVEAIREGEQGKREWGFVNRFRQEDLVPEENWEALFESFDIDMSRLTPLGDMAEISRGISTGETDFFCLSEPDIEEWGIDREHLSRLIRKPSKVQGYDFRSADWKRKRDKSEDVWLLYHLADIDGVPDKVQDADTDVTDRADSPSNEADGKAITLTNLAEYLWWGITEHETLSERWKIREGSPPWYRVERREPAPILIPNARRSDIRAVLNETDARHLSNFLGIYPDNSFNQTEVKALAAYLNSSTADEVARRHERTLAGGFIRQDPGDIENIPVPDPRELPDEVVDTLAKHFDTLRSTARGNNSEEPVLSQINTLLEQELLS